MGDESEGQSGVSDSSGLTSLAYSSLKKRQAAFEKKKRPYNDTTEEWKNAPERTSVFKKLEIERAVTRSLLKAERVYYQAQLHLCLYYSLVRKGSTTEFDEIYRTVRASPYWEHFIDNSSISTIGEYSILQLAVDAVMVFYLVPHVPKKIAIPNVTEKTLLDCMLVRVLELIYFCLIRHLCALTEAYLELLGGKSRAMMSLAEAKFLLTRSLNRQQDKSAGATTADPLPKPRPKSSSTPPSTSHKEPRGFVGETEEEDEVPILKENFEEASGDGEEIADVILIKRNHLNQRKRWRQQLETYMSYGCDLELGPELEKFLKKLFKALDPDKFLVEKAYERTHKRAYKLALGGMELVRLVVLALSLPDDLFMRWKSVVSNARIDFQYFDGK